MSFPISGESWECCPTSFMPKHTLIFRNSAAKHLSGTLLSSDQLTLAGRLLFSGPIVWEGLACSKEAGRKFVWQVCVCVCAGFTLSAEAAQHFGMLLACTEGISGQGEGFLSHKHSWSHGATTSQHHLIRQRDELGRDHLKEGPRESESLNPHLLPELIFFFFSRSVASE